jgi:hypothetical protein
MDALVDVDYTLAADTAIEGVDYDVVSGHLTFQPGETVKQIMVPIRGNDTPSTRNKSFKVRLNNASHAAGIPLHNDGEFPVWIAEDDNPATVSITSVSSESRPEGNDVTTVPVIVRHPDRRVRLHRGADPADQRRAGHRDDQPGRQR